MYLKRLYTNIIKKTESWNYYGLEIHDFDIGNTESCLGFIKKHIQLSEKEQYVLYSEIDDIYKATLFHDLGYNAENSEEGIELSDFIPEANIVSVPDFYTKVYRKYYEYRNKKEHGIYGGIKFIEDMLEIREREDQNANTKRYWGEELKHIFSFVGWIIIAHNIWFIRRNELNNDGYAEMQELVLDDEKDYRIKFDEYPTFFFFCLVDVLEPTKNTSLFSNVKISLKNRKISISTNDKAYSKAIMGLNNWLVPVKKEQEEFIIEF